MPHNADCAFCSYAATYNGAAHLLLGAATHDGDTDPHETGLTAAVCLWHYRFYRAFTRDTPTASVVAAFTAYFGLTAFAVTEAFGELPSKRTKFNRWTARLFLVPCALCATYLAVASWIADHAPGARYLPRSGARRASWFTVFPGS